MSVVIIAMHSSKILREMKSEDLDNLMMIHSVALLAFQKEEDNSEAVYNIDVNKQLSDLEDKPTVIHYKNGCTLIHELSDAIKYFNEVVSLIKTNESYILNRNPRLEESFTW